MSDTFSGLVSPLPHFGLIYVSGPDSNRFLQGQTTIDVTHLSAERCLPGAFCTPKGRVIANFMGLVWQEGILLVLSSELVLPTLAHLGKYAAFFKTTLVDHSKRLHLLGIDEPLDHISTTAISAHWSDSRHIVFLNPLEDDYEAVLERHLTERTVMYEDHWQACDIQAGLAWVDGCTTGVYTPHHINLQWNQGINFRKGCYTGQEVVSRMHFKAKIKSFAFAFQCDSPITANQKLFGRDGQTIGEVINVAKGCVLAVVQQRFVDDGVFADSESKILLKTTVLPYQSDIEVTLLRQSNAEKS